MSTEMTASDLWGATKGPFGLVWNLGKFAYKGVKAANDAAKKREQIEKLKSELQEVGLGNIDYIKDAFRQGKITFEEYRTIKTILES